MYRWGALVQDASVPVRVLVASVGLLVDLAAQAAAGVVRITQPK